MINQLITKHLSKAFDGALKDTVSTFTGTRKGGQGYYDPELGEYVGATNVTYTGRGVASSYNDFEIQASQVDINDIKFICLQSEVTIKPQIDDVITQDGKQRNVLTVASDPASATWVVQLRGINVE